MDCKTARLLLDFARPRELDPDEALALESHLARCPECEALAQAERRLDEHLGRAIRDVAVPEGLRRRLLDRLAAERGRRHRRGVAWIVRLAVAAAILAVVVWLAFNWVPREPPALDLVQLRDENYLLNMPSRERIEEYFGERGRVIVAPDRFNYALLAHYDLVKVQGKAVPLLVFVEGPHRARVYIISGKDFNLDALFRDRPANSGGQSVAVWRDEQRPDFAYVIIYTGESLQRFLTNDPPQQRVSQSAKVQAAA
ncbi:MAG TPA: zf-HC2 domain-containing protein [Gemmataceae bacterium]|nr:zf-HC2 domain-containing protein [Gemmataceae bacterium]